MRLTIKHVLISLVLTGMPFMLFKRIRMCGSLSGQEESLGQILCIDRYCQVQKVFDSCDQRTIITFDVDDTLITASDVLARTPEVPLWFKICVAIKYFTVFLNSEAKEKALDDYLDTFFRQVPRFIFDPDIVRIIKQLQQQKSTVVGLTTTGSGSTRNIKSLPEWRTSMLHSFGIDFSNSCGNTSFADLPMCHGTYPCIYKGIIFANYLEKGLLLGAFLDYFHLKPEQIISFDDQKSALDSIAHECKIRGIHFLGYQMVWTKKLPGEWNTRRALLQFDSALQHNCWLSDGEADAILAGRITGC